MSSAGVVGGVGFRVSIPNSVGKTIQDIKEITGNHSDDEIYAILKDCSMDPNETAQKLLLQDPFHEVKRKRDKRKEVSGFSLQQSLNNRESTESRSRPGTQGRGGRGGRVNFLPRHIPHDAGGGRKSGPGTENGPAHVAEKGAAPSLLTSHETKAKERSLVTSSVPTMVSGPTNVVSGTTTVGPASQSVTETSVEVGFSLVGAKSGGSTSPMDAKKVPGSAYGNENLREQAPPSSRSSSVSPNPASTCFSPSDPVLVPSNDSRLSGSVGTIKREVATHHPPAASEVSSFSAQVKTTSKTHGVGKAQLVTSNHGGSVSRLPSNYTSRSQQLTGSQKAIGTNKEWKPKPVVSSVVQVHTTANAAAPRVPAELVEVSSKPQPVSSAIDSEEATSKLQQNLEELHLPHLPQRNLVILPNHIQVPKSQIYKLSFGSFGATFGVTNSFVSGPESEKSSTPESETSQALEESLEEQTSSNQNVLATADAGDFSDPPQSPTQILENLSSGEGDVSSSVFQGHNESTHGSVMTSGSHQIPVANTSTNYSFGIVPPIMGSQLAGYENSESQARDLSRLPSFVVQQPFDPASYYAQFYRSGVESDGCFSPFPSPGVSTKYNGSVGVLPPNSQSPQEGGVFSTAGPTPMVTQAPGLVQSSIAVTQQPVPVFRPPSGMHISHYPNYIHPYSHYYNPYYVPPSVHQYLGNLGSGAFPQQPQAGGVYPAPPPAAVAGVRYSLPQYKAGNNTGNSNHMGMASGYGPYGSSPTGYNPSPATTAGNTSANEDLSTSQYKDNNVYMTGQQSEGSSVWVATPNREMPSLNSSFYNLPPQGQHIFTPTQGGHGTFAGLYHPAQALSATAVHPLMQQSQTMAGAVDMVGPGGNVYQQPQHAQQMNWPSNY